MSTFFALSLCLSACTRVTTDPVSTSDPTSSTSTDPSTSTTPSTSPTGDTASTATTTVDVDCSVLPPMPVPYDVLTGFTRGEDFDFNGQGQHVSVRGNDLVGIDETGAVQILSPNLGLQTAGTRVLVDGDYVVASSSTGGLIRIDGATGGQQVLNTNMSYPNGVEVDDQGRAYVADNNRGLVRMIDVATGANGVIATGLVQPNGVILSPDEQTLYVGSFGGGVVYAIDRLGDLDWDTPRELYRVSGPDGGFDGINVDHCGNVYITEYTTGRVFRVTPDGARAELVVDLPSGWIPNIRWGNDLGPWRRDRLYVADRDQARLFVLDVGIPGKKHILMP
ncbi:MAG: SMP-30/gluconolactonase/LRE family protein [Myxococcota bacterium]